MGSYLWRISTLFSIIILSISAVSIILPWYHIKSVNKSNTITNEKRYFINYYENEKSEKVNAETESTITMITRTYFTNNGELREIHHTLQICFYFLILGMGFTFVNLLAQVFLSKKSVNKTITILVFNISSAIMYFISSFMAFQLTEDFRKNKDFLPPICESTYCNSFFGRGFNSYKTIEYKWKPDLGWIIVTIAMGLCVIQLIPVVISTVLVFKNKKTKSWKEIIELQK